MPKASIVDLVDCSKSKHKIEQRIEENERERQPKHLKKRVGPKSNGGVGPQGTKGTDRKTGTHFDSVWEYAFWRYHKDILCDIIVRNKDCFFEYKNSQNEDKRFYPDFIVNGGYFEIKGIFRENDLCKKNATLGKVKFLDGNDIKPIIKELNKAIPNWRDDYVKDYFHRREHFGNVKAT